MFALGERQRNVCCNESLTSKRKTCSDELRQNLGEWRRGKLITACSNLHSTVGVESNFSPRVIGHYRQFSAAVSLNLSLPYSFNVANRMFKSYLDEG